MGFIDGKNISLRAVEETDLEIFQKYRNNYEDSKNYRTIKPLTSENQRIYWLEIINSPLHIVFTIVEKSSQNVIGEIRASNITQYHSAELGLWVSPKYRHKGFASEALKLCLEFVFGRANLNRIEVQIASTNINSIKFFERNCFTHEGILRETTYFNFEYQDTIVMSILKKEYINHFKEGSSQKGT